MRLLLLPLLPLLLPPPPLLPLLLPPPLLLPEPLGSKGGATRRRSGGGGGGGGGGVTSSPPCHGLSQRLCTTPSSGKRRGRARWGGFSRLSLRVRRLPRAWRGGGGAPAAVQAAAIRYLRERTDFNRSGGMGGRAQTGGAHLGVATLRTDELWEGLMPQLGAGRDGASAVELQLGARWTRGDQELIANLTLVSTRRSASAWTASTLKRDFPLDDAVQIYREYAGFPQVTRQSLANCRVLFDLGLWAEKSFGALFPVVAEMGAIPAFPPAPMVAERAPSCLSAASTTRPCGRRGSGSASHAGWTRPIDAAAEAAQCPTACARRSPRRSARRSARR